MKLPGEPLPYAAQDPRLVTANFKNTYFEVFRPVLHGGEALDVVANLIKNSFDYDVYGGPLRATYGEMTRSAVLATKREVRTVAEAQQLWSELGSKGLLGALHDLTEEVPALLGSRHMRIAGAQEDPAVRVVEGQETVTGYRLFGIPINEQATRFRDERGQVLEVLGVPVSKRQQQRLYTRVPVVQVSRRATVHDRDQALQRITNSSAQLVLGPARYRLTTYDQ